MSERNGRYTFPEAMPHGALEEVFDGVFFVTGTTRPNFQGLNWQFSRNMTVVREGESLSLINTVRLDEAGLSALDALGKVERVIDIGGFHGFDDPFYVDRYGATLWAPPGKEHDGGLRTDRELIAGGELPFIKRANVGPGWLRASEPQAEDFERIKALSFSHLLSAHGTPLRDDAHAALSATFSELFGV